MPIEVWESSEVDGPVDSHAFNMQKLEFEHSNNTTVLIDSNKGFAEMEDDGNGVTIKINKKKIKLDYYEAIQVLILLQSNVDQSFQFRESKIIKSF